MNLLLRGDARSIPLADESVHCVIKSDIVSCEKQRPGQDCRLILGECLSVLRNLPDASVDAIITDPPYSSGGAFRGDRMGKPSDKYQDSGCVKHADYTGDNRDQHSWAFWCTLWLSECRRVSKPSAPIAIFCDWRQLPTATDVLQAGGWVWRGIAVWDKTEEARPQKGRFRAQAEYIVWGSNGPMPMREDAPCLPGVFRLNNADDRMHMNQKPLDLMRKIVRICPPNGIILDPFLGTGTTALAAAIEGYGCIGIEQDAWYYEIAQRRINRPHAVVPRPGRADDLPLFREAVACQAKNSPEGD